jgi:hypothetical protein
LRITRSHTAALAGTFAAEGVSSARSAVLSFSLWHVTQYRLRTARWGAPGSWLPGEAVVEDCSGEAAVTGFRLLSNPAITSTAPNTNNRGLYISAFLRVRKSGKVSLEV